MTPALLDYLCEPVTKERLNLVDPVYDGNGNITAGRLVTSSGKSYPIINGIPRFVDFVPAKTVTSFGDEWNHFNFINFKTNWLKHTVANTFGSTAAFAGKIIVDAGGGSGSQTKWFAEYGARHVILMDLSHSVDDVVQRNIGSTPNIDVIQCSIDAPPLRDQSINGIVYCHNVIQHTPSVEKTAAALFAITGQGGEFVFNCYPLNDQGIIRWIRFHIIYEPLRWIISRLPFPLIMLYARTAATLRVIPVVGWLLEKSGFLVQGDVPTIAGESFLQRLKRGWKLTCLNTFDGFGSHQYQHHKSESEIRSLIKTLQPDSSKIGNVDAYFRRPPPIGCALRVSR